ncbi:VOC family protein [Clostridium polynesiense]|uniref:VOC family protein n=1 Tax=Clostridium polynesiense TaxID=1325933 RepID=UPI0005917FB3|nr:extradiol dioxygenase [Clostridium polynesiense]
MNNPVFINIMVKDLNSSMEFFKKIGFDFDLRFTDENVACMIISENVYAMLQVREFFKKFTKKDICDAYKSTEAIFSIGLGSKEEVDKIVNKAFDIGGKYFKDPIDYGYMYEWGFEDLDGHLWEMFHMKAMEEFPDQ